MLKFAVISLLVAVAPLTLHAQAQVQWGNSFTADEARNARDKGHVVPLREIFRDLKRRYGGYQVDANLFNQGGGQVYVVDWMSEKGERMRITVDASTGRILSSS